MALNSKSETIGGIDDATKCPCIGSIFVAGVEADTKTTAEWKKLGIKDSKLIIRNTRDKLEKIIKETASSFKVSQITPRRIDDKTFNLNEWEMLVVLEIAGKIGGNSLDKIYVDNWEVNEKIFWKRLENLLMRKEEVRRKIRVDFDKVKSAGFVPDHGADRKYTVVGAASILAKAASDRQYDGFRKKYGDFGSGSPADPATRLFVWKHRKNPLTIIRQSWQTFKHLSKLLRIEDDFIYGRVSKKKKGRKSKSKGRKKGV